MEPLEEHLADAEKIEQDPSPFKVQSVDQAVLQELGLKMNKRLGVDPIQSAQFREMSDFIFDLESALITIDTTQRKTYTVPFLENDDRYSTFNLVVVTDSLDNLLDQYILQYGFDSLQYSTFLAGGDFLESGVEIKRFSFSSFFNDSNPLALERCQGISDENGDPVECDEVTIDAGSSGGGGTSGGGTAWVSPGGDSSGSGSSGSGSSGGGGIPCSWTVHLSGGGDPRRYTPTYVVTISCPTDPYMRKHSSSDENLMTCMDCDISDFGTPAFIPFPEEDDKLPGGKYWESEEYLRKLMATLQEYRLQADPGVKDYRALNNSEKFLHILSHVNHNRHLRQNFKTTDIMSNVPRIAPAGPFKLPGGWYESSEAAIRINGKVYRIGYVFGNQHGYNYVNMMQLPDIRFPVGKDQFNVYYMDVNVPGRTALEIYFPKELYQWFMENYYY